MNTEPKPFIAGQQAFLAGKKRGENPCSGADKLIWEQVWLMGENIKTIADQDAWAKQYLAALKDLFADYQQHTPEDGSITFEDYCWLNYTDKKSRRMVEKYAKL